MMSPATRPRVKAYPPAKRRRVWWGLPRMTVKLVLLVAVINLPRRRRRR